MFRKLTLLALLSLLVVAGCSDDQRSTLQTMVANPAADSVPAVALASPESTLLSSGFTLLATPTLDPIADGPLGTWTAIAQTIAPPTPDPRQYEIVNRGVPHFIEFHAWW